MSIEQGGPSEKEIVPIRDEEISTISASEEGKLNPFQKLRKSFSLRRKAENIVVPEQEDPEFIEWLRSISLNPDQLPFDPTKISDPELAKEIQKTLNWFGEHARGAFDKAEEETDMQKKELSLSVGKNDLRCGWINAVGEYVDAMGDDVYEELITKMRAKGGLSYSERNGLSALLTRGLVRQMRQWRMSGDFYEDSQRKGFRQWPKEELKDIFDEIRSGTLKKPQPSKWNTGDELEIGQTDAIVDYRNRSPLFAILTYERAGGSEELLVFALKKLEIMGLYSNGGMDLQINSGDPNVPKGVYDEYVTAGDCIILAARIAELLGDKVKQHELYKKAYYFFGKMGKSETRLEGLTPMTSYFAENTYYALVERLADCARGANLPEAEFWKKAYEKATGKIPKNNLAIDASGESLPKNEDTKALPKKEIEESHD